MSVFIVVDDNGLIVAVFNREDIAKQFTENGGFSYVEKPVLTLV